MKSVTISEIEDKLRELPPEKLAVVYEFVTFLMQPARLPEGFDTMVASEPILARDWEKPEEDEAWAHL